MSKIEKTKEKLYVGTLKHILIDFIYRQISFKRKKVEFKQILKFTYRTDVKHYLGYNTGKHGAKRVPPRVEVRLIICMHLKLGQLIEMNCGKYSVSTFEFGNNMHNRFETIRNQNIQQTNAKQKTEKVERIVNRLNEVIGLDMLNQNKI